MSFEYPALIELPPENLPRQREVKIRQLSQEMREKVFQKLRFPSDKVEALIQLVIFYCRGKTFLNTEDIRAIHSYHERDLWPLANKLKQIDEPDEKDTQRGPHYVMKRRKVSLRPTAV